MTKPSRATDDDGQRTILHVGPAPVPRPEGRRPPPPPPPRAAAVPEPGAPVRVDTGVRSATMPLDLLEVTVGAVLTGTRYRILKLLGDGGMGTVYEAEHVDIERRVALKILRPEFTRTPEIVEQFRREARAASKVGSEHIVQVFDFAELPGRFVMFTMELVTGPTLRQELRAGPIPPARAIALLRQICKGLDAAHQAGVVHRDVKPENIVIEHRRGRADAVKLLDFGIAAMMGEDLRPLSAGTPHYLAPELVTGASFDRRADIYAVGCTAYEMLTGRPPFAADATDVEDVLGSHLADTAERPSVVRPDLGISPALDRVIMRCLAKLPSNRFRTMVELEAALCAAQIDAGLQTSWDDLPLPDSVDPELRERLLREMPDMHAPIERRRRGWVVPTLALLCLALAGTATYVWLARGRSAPTRNQAAPSEVDQLVADARAAGARSAYVVPTPEDPTGATAFAKVRALEAIGDDAANEAALALRMEFAATLTRLGDSYWEREGGHVFAVEYYRQALVFDRTAARARARAELDDDAQLEQLSRKAEAIEFTPQEIAAARPPSEARRDGRRAGPEAAAPAPGGNAPVPAPAAEGGAAADDGEVAPLPPRPTQAGSDEQAGAADLAKSAKKLLAAGLRKDAEEMFLRALTYDPNNAASLAAMYGIEAARGDYTDALEYAERLVANAPQIADHHMKLGEAEMKLGEYADARRAFERAAGLGAKAAAAKLAKLDELSPRPAAPPEAEAPADDAAPSEPAAKAEPEGQAAAEDDEPPA
ncbi:MAG: protein kinase [Nannocystaceae bacterium]|nr:protein kinase [Nannocystaceae bacterium]